MTTKSKIKQKMKLKQKKIIAIAHKDIKPKILSPAADWPMLRTAIESGCDEIYFGVTQLNMRITAKNFEISEINKIVKFCHEHNVKANLCINTIIYDDELAKLEQILRKAKEADIDAIICWDFSVIKKCSELKIPFHVSTQASISNFESLKFFADLGASRVILARELTLDQIKEIKDKIKKHKINIELECFVHGAMCVSISGRCFMSQEIFNRSANRGDCLQPCRRKYLIKDTDKEFDLELGEDYVLSPKDLCALPVLDKLVGVVDVFKIEGRNRSPEYVKTATECYRKAVDAIFEKKFNNQLVKKLTDKLKTVYNRGFSTGFFLGKPINEWSGVYGSKATETKEFVGTIKNFYKKLKVAEVKVLAGEIKIGDKIIIHGNKTGVFDQKITSMQIHNKNVMSVKKGERVGILLKKTARENDKVFKVISTDVKLCKTE